jgi:hypothetical protein
VLTPSYHFVASVWKFRNKFKRPNNVPFSSNTSGNSKYFNVATDVETVKQYYDFND